MREGFGIVAKRIKRKVAAGLESLRYQGCGREALHRFVVVSCQRNAGESATNCLDSIYRQRYPKHLVRHLFVDDASDDGTADLVRGWLTAHPDHSVTFICNPVRLGGTRNTLKAMAMAGNDDIVAEVNGDDWLPDPGVFAFLDRVYADDSVWMTYNSLRLDGGPPVPWARAYSREEIRNNAFRDLAQWTSSHLHTFRKRLFDHVPPEAMIDPETGDYWECADDQALYLAMLELAGEHSRHLSRITYVYNFREGSHAFGDNRRSEVLAGRIRQGQRCTPLASLQGPASDSVAADRHSGP